MVLWYIIIIECIDYCGVDYYFGFGLDFLNFMLKMVDVEVFLINFDGDFDFFFFMWLERLIIEFLDDFDDFVFLGFVGSLNFLVLICVFII